ncbi:hypothetical protein QUF63_09255 [Anaerolineales bacterium HSG25]|nr:hypothetical protein [Anaerolineales bacterium HSG25]
MHFINPWLILRKSFDDFREDTFFFVLFNMFWVTSSIPGFLLLGYGALIRFLPLVIIGIIVLIPWPLATFSLFHLAYRAAQKQPLSLNSFFTTAWQLKQPALIWGAINLLVLAILLSNIRFYTGLTSPLAHTLLGTLLRSLFTVLLSLWMLWQLFTLAIYPRLKQPSFLLAVRNAGVLILKFPVPTFFVAIVSGLLLISGTLIPLLGFLVNISFITLIVNRAIIEIRDEENSLTS